MEAGILGGTFDPIHVGHIAMARIMMDALAIDRVWIIPDGDPPHKGELTNASDRLEMARLAARDEPGMSVSDMEIMRAGVTYTVDTLTTLHAANPQTRYVYAVGADTLAVIETWRDFGRVARLLAALFVVPRAGTDARALAEQARYIREKYALDVRVATQPVADVSSTEIRNRVARHQSIDGMVPDAVRDYIREKNLYRDPMIEELRRTLSPNRFRHTLGVEKTALELARLYGVDPEKARIAALLHDCAKHMPMDAMHTLVKRHRIETSPGETHSRALLHAAAGVALAEDVYHIHDPDILGAIRWHTTGCANMTALEKVIYLADMIEPNRRAYPALKEIRQLAYTDLDRAMHSAAHWSVEYVKSRGMPLNIRTLELINAMDDDAKLEDIP